MTEKLTYKLVLQGNDGKTYYANINWLSEQLGLTEIKSRLHNLEKPLRKQQILKVLKQEGFRTEGWLWRHIEDFEWWDFRELLDEGKVFSERHGTRMVYGVVNEP